MADIELVIKIPKEVKNRLCFGVTYTQDIQVVCEALNNGTPLPKGHGDLIDKNVYMKSLEDRVQDLNNKDTLKNHEKIHGISIAYNFCARTSAIIPAERSDTE